MAISILPTTIPKFINGYPETVINFLIAANDQQTTRDMCTRFYGTP